MKRLLLCAFVTLTSCAETVTESANQTIPGWRTAGLEAPSNGEGDTQWVKLVAAGNQLVSLNTMGGLWSSSSYSSGWKKIDWKYQGIPYSIFADKDTVFVGTKLPSRLFKCAMQSWGCIDLKSLAPDTAGITAIAKIQGNLIYTAEAYPHGYIHSLQEGTWLDWRQGHPNSSPYRFLEIGDTLWSATWENGLWYRVWGEDTWKRQAPPAMTWAVKGSIKNDTAIHPRGLTWHRGSLWVGDWAMETTEIPGGKAPYRAARNCPPDVDTCHRDLPVNILAMTSWKNRLFVAGYFGASGHVFDDSSRQWIPLEDSWCWNNMADCGGTRTRDLVGLGDTLYAATNRFIMKFPIADLPKMTPAIAAKYHWPRDTTWRDKFLYITNPPRP